MLPAVSNINAESPICRMPEGPEQAPPLPAQLEMLKGPTSSDKSQRETGDQRLKAHVWQAVKWGG